MGAGRCFARRYSDGGAVYDVDRFPASLESEAGERTLSKVGIQVQWPILKKIPIAADKMGTELEPAVHKFSENGCEKRFLFTTFVTIIT